MIFKNKNILVIAAHPDDETIGCGATLALAKKNGCKIEVLFFGCFRKYLGILMPSSRNLCPVPAKHKTTKILLLLVRLSDIIVIYLNYLLNP